MKYITIILFLFSITNTFAQKGEWKNYYPKYNNIPHSCIHKMLIDSKGNKWISTEFGLAKYDGKKWTQYTPDNCSFLDSTYKKNPSIYSFTVDNNDNLWLATQTKGVIFYNGKKWSVYNNTNSPLYGYNVSNVISDNKGGIWIYSMNTKGYGLNHFDGTKWEFYNFDTLKIPGNVVFCMKVDNKQNLWMGSKGCLIKFDGKKWNYYKTETSAIKAIDIDSKGNVWFCPKNEGFYIFDGKSHTKIELSSEPINIVSIAIDKKDNIWLAKNNALSRDNSIIKYNKNGFAIYDEFNSGLKPNITSIIIDSLDILWVGTRFNISVFDGTNWDIIGPSEKDNIPDHKLASIAIDKNNTKWIASHNYGLLEYDGVKWKTYANHNSDIPWQHIKKIKIDKNDTLWLCSEQGLIKYDRKNWTIYNTQNSSLPFNAIKDFAVDRNNALWLCKNDKLAHKNGKNWDIYSWENTILPKKNLTCIVVDDSNHVWVGTDTHGLYKYDGNNWSNYNKLGNVVNCIFIDKKGTKWIGTNYGVYKIEKNNWTMYNSKDIKGTSVENIAEDFHGNIWVGFHWQNGISKFDGKQWKNYNNKFYSYNSFEIVGVISNNIAIDKDGNIWVADPFEGLFVFNEDKIVSIEKNSVNKLPNSYILSQNYPNPFNPSTNISYYVPPNGYSHNCKVTLKIYDLLGKEISTLVNKTEKIGWHRVIFNPNNLASGVYIYRLQTNGKTISKKMILMK